jgi:hypothetical protein
MNLDVIAERNPGPLTRGGPKERCFIGIFRDYAVLLCVLIRAQGRPARSAECPAGGIPGDRHCLATGESGESEQVWSANSISIWAR